MCEFREPMSDSIVRSETDAQKGSCLHILGGELARQNPDCQSFRPGRSVLRSPKQKRGSAVHSIATGSWYK